MAKKLLEKAGLIQHPALPSAVRPDDAARSESTADLKPKTAPGAMMHFLATQSHAMKETELLKEKLETFVGSLAVRSLDPVRIAPSRWANRHPASFEAAEYTALREEIRSAGSNIQPIKVRPVRGVKNVDYEIVFGHRRHRACLDLELPVLAMIEEVSDQELFSEMDRENRQRADLSAWEQGQIYRKALDEGLYGSLRRLADAIGADPGNVSKAITLARLPDAVIESFPSPLTIQFNWGPALSAAVQKDPEGTIARARELAPLKLGAREVFDALTGIRETVVPYNTVEVKLDSEDGKRSALIKTDTSGKAVIKLSKGVMNAKVQLELTRFIQQFLG